MKKIGIYTPSFDVFSKKWDEYSIVGGSETWAQYISKEFVKFGYDVYLFCNCNEEHISLEGVHYIPLELFSEKNKELFYDYFIISRYINAYTDEIKCDNIYLILHDHIILGDEYYKLDKIKKISYLTEFQKMFIMSIQPHVVTCDKVFRSGNGVDITLYEGKCDKKNKMVWSMTPDRGLRHFLTNIFPRIKQAVPDFELDVCSYQDISSYSDLITDGVNFLGSLSKEELSQKQKESKIWVYPCHYVEMPYKFRETFCISAVENALSENAIIAANIGGVSTIFKDYSGLYGWERDWENDEWYINEAIKCLTDEKYRISKVNEIKDVAKEYTWENIALSWLNEWGEPIKETLLKKAKVIKLFKKNDDVKNEEFYKSHLTLDITESINETDFLINEPHNKHHLKQEWHYNKLLPQMDEILNFGYNKNDFNIFVTTDKRKSSQFMFPKELHYYDVEYYDFHWDGLVQESWTAFLRKKENMTFFELCPLNKINSPDFYSDCIKSIYHEQFYFSHQCVKITNKNNNNGRTLLISCDSHGIPSIPILCCYFKTVIVLDKRYNIQAFKRLTENEKIDDVLILDGIHPLDYYIEKNFS